MDLQLALNGEYFDQIKAGTKNFEYRLCNDYWTKRLSCRDYNNLILTRGYPKRGDMDKTIILPYRGYEIHNLTHKHFGEKPVTVYAIRLKEPTHE